ncbi:twin-arginine translocation signal domain-containing protein [Halovenus salina]|uniref:Twin-arginine translocation signal domain-containing protein n=1 Tax=Halovenus salina TaxID=1510225 RepID=A0ABD5W740_9EURY
MSERVISRPSRRRFLAGSATAAVTAVTGCSTVLDWIGDQALEAVNVLNGTDGPVSGRLEIVGADGTVVLDERFDLVSSDSAGEEERGNMAFYENVWPTADDYEATIELDETEIDGHTSATERVSITTPDEEMLLVALEADDLTGPIAFRTGEKFSELLEE